MHVFRLLNKLSVTKLAELSNLSKPYISQVKHGKRPPSQKLVDALANYAKPIKPEKDYLATFLESREAMGVSPKTLEFYKDRLTRFTIKVNYVRATRRQIQQYLNSIPPNKNGLATRHASFRAIKAFYRWLNTDYGIPNPVEGLPAPILNKPILPALEMEQVLALIEEASNTRDKAIIALFTESGLRLSELANIGPDDINWCNHTIKVLGKGRKEAYAPFGKLTTQYLKEWLNEYQPNSNIWGINRQGIITMLRRLEERTGTTCNPHTFRRTFACLLRKAGLDSLMIRDLGRWESLEMVQRYTRSITFEDCLAHYRRVSGSDTSIEKTLGIEGFAIIS